jgi:hypothetical protein
MMTLPRYANLALKRCSENRDMAFAMSAATVGKLAAHPPVPRSKAMIPVSTVAGHSAHLTESDSPSACPAATYPCDTFEDYGRMMCDGYSFKYE